MPTAPLMVDEAQPREGLGPARDGLGAAHFLRHAATEVAAQNHVGVEHGDERVEVALARCGKERVDHLALAVEVGVGRRPLALHPSSRAARQLARRLR
jgi:hypothetical protein